MRPAHRREDDGPVYYNSRKRDAGSSYPVGLLGAWRFVLPVGAEQAKPVRSTNMALNPDQLKHLDNWINQKVILAVCPACASPNAKVDGVHGILTEEGGRLALTSESLRPCVSLTCANCGLIRLFAAEVMQLPS